MKIFILAGVNSTFNFPILTIFYFVCMWSMITLMFPFLLSYSLRYAVTKLVNKHHIFYLVDSFFKMKTTLK